MTQITHSKNFQFTPSFSKAKNPIFRRLRRAKKTIILIGRFQFTVMVSVYLQDFSLPHDTNYRDFSLPPRYQFTLRDFSYPQVSVCPPNINFCLTCFCKGDFGACVLPKLTLISVYLSNGNVNFGSRKERSSVYPTLLISSGRDANYFSLPPAY